METLDEILAHHGIKGMRWGVRGGMPTMSAPPSQDHTNVQVIKGKAKSGGRKALSNNELQAYVTRVNLERQFTALQPGSQAKKFLVDLLVGVGKQQVTRIANDAAGQQVNGLLKKKAAA
jgi:hypothetical protein